jgi:hypothetical protein
MRIALAKEMKMRISDRPPIELPSMAEELNTSPEMVVIDDGTTIDLWS